MFIYVVIVYDILGGILLVRTDGFIFHVSENSISSGIHSLCMGSISNDRGAKTGTSLIEMSYLC